MSYNTEDIVFNGLALGTICSVAFIGSRYRVCKPEQMMIRTGLGIKDMLISKKGIQWPLQKYFMTNMTPTTHSFNLHNMSNEKVEFKLPVIFTICPIHPSYDKEGFERYVRYMNDVDDDAFHDTLAGMIDGKMRMLTASMTIDEMFSGKEEFQKQVVDKIGVDLSKIGINILNANIKEMSDYDEKNKFFEYRKQRAIETANNHAKKDVAQAQKEGEIGMKKQETEKRIKVAELDKNSIQAENQRLGEIAKSKAELAEAEALSKKRTDIANVQAKVAAQKRQAELKKELYIKTQEQEIEKKRAKYRVKATVEAEALIVESKGKAKSMQLIADADFYKKQKEADGIYAVYKAQADGLNKIIEFVNKNSALVQFHMALEKDLYPTISKHGADAVKDIKPYIKVWNTGSDPENPFTPIIKGVQSMNPLIYGITRQGNMTIPNWMHQVGSLDKKEDSNFPNQSSSTKYNFNPNLNENLTSNQKIINE